MFMLKISLAFLHLPLLFYVVPLTNTGRNLPRECSWNTLDEIHVRWKASIPCFAGNNCKASEVVHSPLLGMITLEGGRTAVVY